MNNTLSIIDDGIDLIASSYIYVFVHIDLWFHFTHWGIFVSVCVQLFSLSTVDAIDLIASIYIAHYLGFHFAVW